MKYVPCSCESAGTDASMIPVMPPNVNMERKPSVNHMAVVMRTRPRHSVATHEKILMPVGMPTAMVRIMNGNCTHCANPLVNIWCAQTMNETRPIVTDE